MRFLIVSSNSFLALYKYSDSMIDFKDFDGGESKGSIICTLMSDMIHNGI